MSKLTKLTIKKFRNVVPTTLEFRPGLNIVLGKNAAGKTTLLRLLSTVLGTRAGFIQDEVLDVTYRAVGKSLGFEHTIVRTQGNELALSHEPELPMMRVKEFSSVQQTERFVFEKDGIEAFRAEVSPSHIVIEKGGQTHRFGRESRAPAVIAALIALEAKLGSAELAHECFLATVGSGGRMDESLERLDALLGLELEGNERQWRWSFRAGVPRSMLHTIPAMPMPDGTSTTFSLEFLDRVAQVLGYDSANARFDLERLNPEPGQHVVRLSNLRFFFKRPGEEISHDFLSYGQKRLLAFFAHADASHDVVIADELVNGLHHEWISACLDEIGDRQAFLTSQNPLLLDFLRFESAEEVRRAFILCERGNRENGAQLIWRNPTAEEAESFFSAYQTGIQRVSDILLTKGLW